MLSFLSRFFGGHKSHRDVSSIMPIVASIQSYEPALKALSNDALRQKTHEFKARIQAHIQPLEERIARLHNEADALSDEQIFDKENIYKSIDDLQTQKNKDIEAVLMQILPEAFAVVKETARRFKDNATITATATDLDRTLAQHKKYITLLDDKAVYANHWMVGGNDTTWNMVHYDVQLIGGIVLHQGKISEMSTGEGKTLVSTLPAYLNALAGEGVHIVTVNDYLAKRDCQWNAPIFEFLGLHVDCIDLYQPHTEARQKAYLADITYGTNNEFGFDYLRDNMVHTADEMVQRKKHFFAMVDEVDSVLIDDARTPLIISGPTAQDDSQKRFFELRPRIERLIDMQKRVVNQFLNEAKQKITSGDDDAQSGGLALLRAFRGLPKYGALIKYLSEPNVKVVLQKTENVYLAENQKRMPEVDKELYFKIDEKNNTVDLTEKGLHFLSQDINDSDFFILPDLSTTINHITTDASLSEQEKIQKKEHILNEYAVKSDRIHSIQQLLKAFTLFEKDVAYVVLEGQVKIVDEQTGRIMEGRRYSDGLHQAIEAKENVKIEGASQTYATITLQNYFRMYHKLAGMTGTAETEAQEFWQIYKLDVVSIPTHLPIKRKDGQDMVFKTKREKYKAIIEEVEKLVTAQRSVLVGTTSVEVSELLSRMLKQRNIAHNVLNAKQHAKEAQIVAEAGLPGKVTIATNMAGRGTDIKLHPIVKDNGGLAIIGTERHESRRVDRQLRGRSGRQGDPGSTQFFVSLEDDLMRMFGSDRIASLMDKMGYKEGEVIQHSLVTKSIERAQKKVEENNFGIRKRLLEYDDVMNKQRNAIYTKRKHALFGERLQTDIDNAFYETANLVLTNSTLHNNSDQLNMDIIAALGIDANYHQSDLNKGNIQDRVDTLYHEALTHYHSKKTAIAEECLMMIQQVKKAHGDKYKNIAIPFTDGHKILQVSLPIDDIIANNGKNIITEIEKNINLILIDDHWKEHLRLMDELRHSVQSAVYEQKDPLVIYKVEAFEYFKRLNHTLTQSIITFLVHLNIDKQNQAPQAPRKKPQSDNAIKTIKDDLTNDHHESVVVEDKKVPFIADPKIKRNDPCPCGSGKKYKQCHGV